jgi:hypothetical protein
MERAILAMWEAGVYNPGHPRWAFAGKHEAGCEDAVRAGFIQRGADLRVYESRSSTLTSKGYSKARQVYMLTAAGVEMGKRLQEEKKKAADAEI